MTVSVVRDRRFIEHDPGVGHPERPQRMEAILDAIEGGPPLDLKELEPRAATREEVERNHTPEYVDRLEELRGRVGQLDADTVLSERTIELAFDAAGATIDLCNAIARKDAPPGIALVRPPGHHAVSDRAMGFCMINNVAVAARALIAEGLAERVAIYDWDIHHGNGTEDSFYEDPSVLYLSTHQFPFYPGTGRAKDVGANAGEGMTLNVPLPAGTDDRTLLSASTEVLFEKTRNFSPDMILISAGFDGHEDDPLGQFRITLGGFEELAARWRELAEEVCGGRIAAVLEGGYDLDGLSSSVVALMKRWDT